MAQTTGRYRLSLVFLGLGCRPQPAYRDPMSLLGYLYRGELGDWCDLRLTGSRRLARALVSQAKENPCAKPQQVDDRREWDRAGKTFIARLSAVVQAAPPYSALLGLARIGLTSRRWADRQAIHYPTHALLTTPERERALDLRPTPQGWIDLRAAVEQGAAIMPETSIEAEERLQQWPGMPYEPVLGELFDRTRTYFQTHAPLGSLGTEGAEQGLLRLSWVLAACTYTYRNPSVGHPLFTCFRNDPPTVEKVHTAASDDVVTAPAALVRYLRKSGSFDQMRTLAGTPPAGTPWGVTAPVIFDQWNDETFLLGGPGEATFLDVSTVSAFDGDHARRRLRLLLAKRVARPRRRAPDQDTGDLRGTTRRPHQLAAGHPRKGTAGDRQRPQDSQRPAGVHRDRGTPPRRGIPSETLLPDPTAQVRTTGHRGRHAVSSAWPGHLTAFGHSRPPYLGGPPTSSDTTVDLPHNHPPALRAVRAPATALAPPVPRRTGLDEGHDPWGERVGVLRTVGNLDRRRPLVRVHPDHVAITTFHNPRETVVRRAPLLRAGHTLSRRSPRGVRQDRMP